MLFFALPLLCTKKRFDFSNTCDKELIQVFSLRSWRKA